MTHRDTFVKTLQLFAAAAAIVATPAVAFAADTTTAATTTSPIAVAAAPAAQQTAPTTPSPCQSPRACGRPPASRTFSFANDAERDAAMLPAGPRVLSGDGGG